MAATYLLDKKQSLKQKIESLESYTYKPPRLKSSGSVVAFGLNSSGQCKISARLSVGPTGGTVVRQTPESPVKAWSVGYGIS